MPTNVNQYLHSKQYTFTDLSHTCAALSGKITYTVLKQIYSQVVTLAQSSKNNLNQYILTKENKKL